MRTETMRLNRWLLTVACVTGLAAGANAAESQSAAQYAKQAQSAFRSGDYKAAAKLFEKAVKLEPANPDLRDGLGRAYERQAEAASFPFVLTAKARQNFVEALELRPNHAGAIEDLVALNQQPIGLCQGDLKVASQLIDRLGALDPEAAKREREIWKDAKQDASRTGQMALCAPVKVSRVLTEHLVPGKRLPAAAAVKPEAVVTEAKSEVLTIGAGSD